jgi:hypothetical protein
VLGRPTALTRGATLCRLCRAILALSPPKLPAPEAPPASASRPLFPIHARQGFKVGLCGQAPVGLPYSLLALSNSCCMADTLGGLLARFSKLYKRRRARAPGALRKGGGPARHGGAWRGGG